MRTYLLLSLLLLNGCATWGARESRVILPSGEEYRVYAQHDGKLDFQKGDVKVSIDNRGRPSLLEQAISAPMVGIVGTAGATINNSVKEAVVK